MMAADKPVSPYRFPAIRVLDDGCMACNLSVVACDAAKHHGSKCCGYCDHKAAE